MYLKGKFCIIINYHLLLIVVQLLSHIWLFVTPMDCSTPGSSILQFLPESAQIHVHWVGDAI